MRRAIVLLGLVLLLPLSVQAQMRTIWGGIVGGDAAPAGTGSELQYRLNATTLGAVTGSSVSGSNVSFPDYANLQFVTGTEAPYAIEVAQSTFNGTVDPILHLGYNIGGITGPTTGRIVLTEPYLGLMFEGNYNDGATNIMESYFDYSPVGRSSFRPWNIAINRASDVVQQSFKSDDVQFLGPVATGFPVGVRFDLGHADTTNKNAYIFTSTAPNDWNHFVVAAPATATGADFKVMHGATEVVGVRGGSITSFVATTRIDLGIIGSGHGSIGANNGYATLGLWNAGTTDGLQLYNGGSWYLNSGAAGLILRVNGGDAVTIPGSGDIVSARNVTAPAYKLSALNTAPASATAAGTLGEIRIAADYIYVCVATNTWVRAALATW